MAAKVVMVAVPAVVGAASIRIYRVRDEPKEGLITRERLNIYSPLHQAVQVQDIPEVPGIIESGLSKTRQTIVPVVQAVKGAYISVKRGTVNFYHAGQDVYYYLKDPPPEFLPRFGTITMAGLLGMFLARKGSYLKRVALPMGLMTAGASVCYPVQAVAVLKVTGKKVYATGQWSRATISSLLSSPPKPTVTEEASASPSQEEKLPTPEPAVVEEVKVSETSSEIIVEGSIIYEADVNPSVSAPLPEEPVIAESSSDTLTQTETTAAAAAADQPSAEQSTDLVVDAVVAETETVPPPEDLPAAVESEKPPEHATSEEAPSEPTLRVEPEVVQSAATEDTPLTPSTEEVSATTPTEPRTVTVVESEPELVFEPVVASEPPPAEKTPAATVEETPAPPPHGITKVVVVSAQPVLTKEPVRAAVEETSTPASSQELAKEAVDAESALKEEPLIAAVEESPATAPPTAEEPIAEIPKVRESLEPEAELAPEPQAADIVVEPLTKTSPLSEKPANDHTRVVAPEPEAVVESVVTSEPPPAEETLAPTDDAPPSSEEPAAEIAKGNTGFKADPALMDFGQSNPEDADLYSTRS